MADDVRVEVAERVALLTLNRPASYNALDLGLARALAEALLALGGDPGVRALVITGAGRAFSSGGDIKRALAHPHGAAAAFYELATHVHVAVGEIRRMRKPVVAAVNGVAAGGGFSLALACDLRLMATSARLRQSFTSNALCIDAGGTFTLPRLVGLARALEIAALDESIAAEQALAWGLATRVVPDETLLDEALALARRLAERSLSAFGEVKALLTDSFDTPWEAQLERERQGLARCVAHPDGAEGLRAFVEKRAPRYGEQ